LKSFITYVENHFNITIQTIRTNNNGVEFVMNFFSPKGIHQNDMYWNS